MWRAALVAIVATACRGGADFHVIDGGPPPIDARCAISGQLTGTIAGHMFGPLTDVRYTPAVSDGPPPFLLVTDGALALTWEVGIGGNGVQSVYNGDPIALQYDPSTSSMTTTGAPCVVAMLHVAFVDGEIVDGTLGAESN